MSLCQLSMRAFRRDPRGTAAIEFAIVGPILILVMFGVISFGDYFWTQSEVANGIEKVLREAAIARNLSEDEIQTRLKIRLARIDDGKLDISTAISEASETTPSLLTVSVQYTYSPIGPLYAMKIPISATGQVPIIELP